MQPLVIKMLAEMLNPLLKECLLEKVSNYVANKLLFQIECLIVGVVITF